MEKIEEKLIYSTTNEFDVEQICQILKNNEIPFIKKDSGSGQYM